MKLRSIPTMLALLCCLCGTAAAKPEPDAPTLKFIAACVRDFAWSEHADRPATARNVLKVETGKTRHDFFEARREVHASRTYLRGLSVRAFRRHLADALYLTTSRSVPRVCVANAAAKRGLDVIENCARMNDALHSERREPEAWEDAIVERDSISCGGMLEGSREDIPDRLAQIYRRYPDERILQLIFYPAGRAGCGCGGNGIVDLVATHTTAVLRFASKNKGVMVNLPAELSGDVNPEARKRARRNFTRIESSGGPLAPAARRCLQDMARWDADYARRNRH